MSYAIVFSSKTGNTRLLADTLRASLPQNECTYFGAPAPEALEAETLYIGFWTDKGHADDTLTAFLQTLKGKRVFLFGTAGFGGSAEYFEQILAAVQKSLDESNTVIGTYMCQGKMPMTVRQQYEKMLQQPNHAPNLEMLIENFDKALAHPDAADLDQLRKRRQRCRHNGRTLQKRRFFEKAAPKQLTGSVRCGRIASRKWKRLLKVN